MFKRILFSFLFLINFKTFSMQKHGVKENKLNIFFDPGYVENYSHGNELLLVARSKKEADDFIQELSEKSNKKNSIIDVKKYLEIDKSFYPFNEIDFNDKKTHVFLADYVKKRKPINKEYKFFKYYLGILREFKMGK